MKRSTTSTFFLNLLRYVGGGLVVFAAFGVLRLALGSSLAEVLARTPYFVALAVVVGSLFAAYDVWKRPGTRRGRMG